MTNSRCYYDGAEVSFMGSLWTAAFMALLLAPAAAEKPFVSKWGFSVVVPGTPVESVPAEGIHVLESSHQGVDYAVSVVRLPGGKVGDEVWTFARQKSCGPGRFSTGPASACTTCSSSCRRASRSRPRSRPSRSRSR
jgi:hypothetical protein